MIVRLAWHDNSYARRTMTSPTVRLAVSERLSKSQTSETVAPALLVSYVYLDSFLAARPKAFYRDWVLDSGAFSAHMSGTEIKLQDYIDTCKRLRDSDQTLSEVYALDVIGDWRATLRNTEEMWRQGVQAIPTYHQGAPFDYLRGIARDYPKIALGGVARKGAKLKIDWALQCFGRIWPKRVHGFGYGTEAALMRVPFHSADATSWEMGPCAFGRWKSFGGKLSVRQHHDITSEVVWYLEMERKVQARWRKEMAVLESLP